MPRNSHGKTASGVEITDDLVQERAEAAEAGYDVDATLRRRGGRPPIGTSAARVESVRLDPALSQALAERAACDHATTSGVIRKALRHYLEAAPTGHAGDAQSSPGNQSTDQAGGADRGGLATEHVRLSDTRVREAHAAYWKLERSLQESAKVLGVSEGTLKRHIRALELPIRSIGETQRAISAKSDSDRRRRAISVVRAGALEVPAGSPYSSSAYAQLRAKAHPDWPAPARLRADLAQRSWLGVLQAAALRTADLEAHQARQMRERLARSTETRDLHNQYYHGGLTLAEVAERAGVSKSAMDKRFKRLGLPGKRGAHGLRTRGSGSP